MAEDDAARDPVDIVLTYVDGAAPGFQDQYRQIVGREATPCHVRSLGEVRYALRSIHQHASWARDVIFLTQDLGHVPAWLNTNRVRVVTLDEFMPPEALPSFNPFAIQAWAHRIDGLARRFVLWSDDQLALCPTRAEDFFDGHGTPKVPTHAGRSFFMVGARWDRFSRRLANSFLALDAITPSGTRGRGSPWRRLVSHTPVPVEIELWRTFLDALQDQPGFTETVRSHTRDGTESPSRRIVILELWCSWLLALHPSEVSSEGRVSALVRVAKEYFGLVPAHEGHFSVRHDPEWTAASMARLLRRRPRFACLNDEAYRRYADPQGTVWWQQMELEPSALRSLHAALGELFPQPSPYELT